MANEIVVRIRDRGRNIVDFVLNGPPPASLKAGLSSTAYDGTNGDTWEFTPSGWVLQMRAGDSAPPAGTAGGDLTGTYPSPSVAKLYGNPVSNASPMANGVLKWLSSVWQAALLVLSDLPGQTSTTRKFLVSVGNGVTAGTPFYDTLGASDIPVHPVSKLDGSSATTGQVPTRQADGSVAWATPSGGGSGSARTSVAFTTASIGPGATGTGSVTVPKACDLFRVAADVSCRVRLYTTAAARDADVAATRATTTLPTPGTGVLADSSLSTKNGRTQSQAPVPTCYNDDGTPSTTLYYAVTSYAFGATPFTVTLTLLPLES